MKSLRGKGKKITSMKINIKQKKGTGYFFCINNPRGEKILFLPEKVACPLFACFLLVNRV